MEADEAVEPEEDERQLPSPAKLRAGKALALKMGGPRRRQPRLAARRGSANRAVRAKALNDGKTDA